MHVQDTFELIFEDVRIPTSNLLGEEGEGFKYLMSKWQQEDVNGENLQIGDTGFCGNKRAVANAIGIEVENQPLMCENREYYGFSHPNDLRGGFAEYE